MAIYLLVTHNPSNFLLQYLLANHHYNNKHLWFVYHIFFHERNQWMVCNGYDLWVRQQSCWQGFHSNHKFCKAGIYIWISIKVINYRVMSDCPIMLSLQKLLKFGFSEKATKFEKIFIVLLTRVSCSVHATVYLSKNRLRSLKINVDKLNYTNFNSRIYY